MSLSNGGMLARGFNFGVSNTWPLKRSSELFELKYGKALTEKDRSPGEVPVYGTNGRCGWHSASNFKGPGVILGRKGQGPLGVECCPNDYWVIDTAYSLRLLKDDLDLRYCYYMIKYVGLNHLKDGTSNPSLSRDIFGAQLFPIPPIHDQEGIADILCALDDKIELNRRMNETLEAMTRALFKDWFVDFGPTRAKQAGMEPYLAPELWSLFPERLDAEGKPEGWERCNLRAVATLNSESWSARCKPREINYVDLANTKWGTIETIEPHAWEDAPSRARRVLRAGDTIVGTVRPGNGSYAYIGQDGLTGSTGFAVLRPTHLIYREIVYCAATAPDNIERLSHRADGAAYPAVRPDIVADTELVKGSGSVIGAFSGVCNPMIERIEANKEESRTLAQTRDLLLPKLMSGEIRLREAERLVEAVV